MDWGKILRSALFPKSPLQHSDDDVTTAIQTLANSKSPRQTKGFLLALSHASLAASNKHEQNVDVHREDLPEDSELEYDEHSCCSEGLSSRLSIDSLKQKSAEAFPGANTNQGKRGGLKRRRTTFTTTFTRKIGFLKNSRNTFKVNARKVDRHKVQAKKPDIPVETDTGTSMQKMKAYFQSLDQEETLTCVVSSPSSQRIDIMEEAKKVVLTEEEEKTYKTEYKLYCRGLNGIVKPVSFKEFIHQRNVYDMTKR